MQRRWFFLVLNPKSHESILNNDNINTVCHTVIASKIFTITSKEGSEQLAESDQTLYLPLLLKRSTWHDTVCIECVALFIFMHVLFSKDGVYFDSFNLYTYSRGKLFNLPLRVGRWQIERILNLFVTISKLYTHSFVWVWELISIFINSKFIPYLWHNRWSFN